MATFPNSMPSASFAADTGIRLARRKARLLPDRGGAWVVLLGPDGAGKSSVIGELSRRLQIDGCGCEAFHLRPGLRRKQAQEAAHSNPHGQPARGTTISLLKLAYVFAMNWWWHLVTVRPLRSRGKLVLFDRYFPDCLVDPRRYRLPRSCLWAAEWVSRRLPVPDLYLVLDVPASILQERKAEVSPAESQRQRKEYAMRLRALPNLRMLDASRPLAAVADGVIDQLMTLRWSSSRGRYRVQ